MTEFDEFKRPVGRPPKKLPVKLLKGYFPADGGAKILKGAAVELPAEEARHLVEIGIAVRNDPF